jgi:hypothetical protein
MGSLGQDHINRITNANGTAATVTLADSPAALRHGQRVPLAPLPELTPGIITH